MDDARRALVAALCHEIGNLLAGVRLLGAAADATAAARAAGRAGALLALIPPLVAAETGAAGAGASEPLEVLGALRRQLDGEDDARVRIELASAVSLPAVAIEGVLLHDLLLAQLLAALDSGEGAVRAAASAADGAVRFRVEAGAPGAPASRGGAALVRAVAAAILEARGGAVESAAPGALVLRVPARC